MASVVYRHADEADVETITVIYNTVIIDSHISFDAQPQTVDDRAAWLATKTTDGLHQAWVAEVDGEVVGVAYSGPWRPKSGYAATVETTIVLEPRWTGRGLGTRLLGHLLDALRAAGAHRAIAVVALPNDASIRLHLAHGYRSVGVLDEVGFKLDQYWSTEILQKKL